MRREHRPSTYPLWVGVLGIALALYAGCQLARLSGPPEAQITPVEPPSPRYAEFRQMRPPPEPERPDAPCDGRSR